jgi:hypothetical protein
MVGVTEVTEVTGIREYGDASDESDGVMVPGLAFLLTIHSSLIREFVAFLKIDEGLGFSS